MYCNWGPMIRILCLLATDSATTASSEVIYLHPNSGEPQNVSAVAGRSLMVSCVGGGGLHRSALPVDSSRTVVDTAAEWTRGQ